jgi:hypothetical protein
MSLGKYSLSAALLLTPYFCSSSSHAVDGIIIKDIQVVQSQEENDTTELFGRQGGNLHPYLSIRGEYTDNLYNVNVDEKTNFLTVVSPGIWFATPATTGVPITIAPRNTASGGLRLAVQELDSFNRFQSYFKIGWDFEMYSENVDLDATNYNAEGMLQFNLRGGLSLRVLDRFSQDQDKFDVNSYTINDVTLTAEEISLSDPSNVRRYKNNLAGATLNWDITEKFTARLDYTNFLLRYDGSTNEWLNRTDNSFDAYIYYKYSVKTSIFAEYRYVNAHYNDGHNGMDPEDSDVQDRDNQQNFAYGGINWDITSKTSLMAKAGYQDKSYDAETFGSDNTFSYEIVGKYRVTEKTSLNLGIYKALEESNMFEAYGKDTTRVTLSYNQRFLERLTGTLRFGYSHDNYDQIYSDMEDIDIFQQELPDGREDDRYSITPALQYTFRDWLMGEISYTYDNRDSSRELFKYNTNTIMFSLHSAW